MGNELGLRHPSDIPFLQTARKVSYTLSDHASTSLSNHLGNVYAVISDRKLGVDDDNNNLVDYFEADIASAQDYYPFGSAMPGRQFTNVSFVGDGNRFGFNGQEKTDELAGGNGNHTTALYWEYDARLGRRWNIDPINDNQNSVYSCFTNSPIWFADPDGLYKTEIKAEKMRKRAENSGLDVQGKVFYSKYKKEWAFSVREKEPQSSDGSVTVTDRIVTDQKLFGTNLEKCGQILSDINPFKSGEVYGGVVLKTDIQINSFLKVSVPIFGGQLSYNTDNGFSADEIQGDAWYLSVTKGKLEGRVYPTNGLAKGDYNPAVRVLYSFVDKPIILTIDGVPIPIGKYKVQGDFQSDLNRTTIGGRVVANSFTFPKFDKEYKSGVLLEVNVGGRLELKMPEIFKD